MDGAPPSLPRRPGAEAAIRPAVPADAAAIEAVHIEAWRVVGRDVLPESLLGDLPLDRLVERRRMFLERGRDEERTLVAEAGGSVVGFADVGPARGLAPAPPGTGELYALYVTPARWGTGVGPALLLASEDLLRDRGCPEAVLWVMEANRRARRFYEREGWAADGRRRLQPFVGALVAEALYRRRWATTSP